MILPVLRMAAQCAQAQLAVTPSSGISTPHAPQAPRVDAFTLHAARAHAPRSDGGCTKQAPAAPRVAPRPCAETSRAAAAPCSRRARARPRHLDDEVLDVLAVF